MYGRLLVALVVMLATGACSDAPPETCLDDLRLRLLGEGDSAVQQYLVAVTLRDGATQVVECGVEDAAHPEQTGDLACTEEGAEITGDWSTNEIVVKARGYEFVVTHVAVPVSSDDCKPSTVTIELVPLDEIEQNDDYATGFGKDDVELFKEMSVYGGTELGATYALKFYMRNVYDSPEVFFQNTDKHGLHYSFAKKVLGYPGSAMAFSEDTYYNKDRDAFAGTILFRPDLAPVVSSFGAAMPRPYCLTFFPSDSISPEQVLLVHGLIEERIELAPLAGASDRLIYEPAGSTQEAQATEETASFEMRDIVWASRQELYKDIKLQLLNPGTAFGTLRRFSPEEMEKTVVSFTDVLLLTRLPNSLPVVGGTITEELQTPLAHVNIAAQTRGTPNIALLGASEDDRVKPYIGKLVKFVVGDKGFTLEEATQKEAEEYWESVKKDPFAPPHNDDVEGLPLFSEMGFGDSPSFGVKAANLAELSHILPDNTPDGFGVPFFYYNQYIATSEATSTLCDGAKSDCIEEGRDPGVCKSAHDLCKQNAGDGTVLWDFVEGVISDTGFKSDTFLREAALDNVAWIVSRGDVDPEFGAALDARVEEVVGSGKVKLRSSTNAEDLPNFSGAGLYESHGATSSGEKAASKRIREVWASVWRWKAFEERSFWNIDHMAVRMGICASRSFPDEEANGVIITRNIIDPFAAGFYVNVQLGEISVTNPEDGSTPEAFSILPNPGGGIQVAPIYYSNLSPGKAIMSESEVSALYSASKAAQKHFAKLYGEDPYYFALDMEFKLDDPDRKVYLKQARPYTPLGGTE